MHDRIGRGLVSALVVLMASAPAPGQSVLGVPAQFPTIQGAVIASVSGDRIEVAPGTYNEDLDFLGKNITVLGTGGPLATEIVGTGIRSVVSMTGGEGPSARLQGFTIRGGNGFNGGALRILGSFGPGPMISDCIFDGNLAQRDGGAMHVQDSAVTVTGCTFHANAATRNGGAIVAFGSPITIVGCLFDQNLAAVSGGAADFALTTATISSSRFQSNEASTGGAIAVNDGAAVVTDCDIVGNTAIGTFGAGGVLASEGFCSLTRCLVEGNESRSSDAGGVLLHCSGAVIESCDIKGNRAVNGRGGGVYFSYTTGEMVNTFVTGNEAMIGAGLALDLGSTFTVLHSTVSANLGDGLTCESFSVGTVRNSIVWGNTGPALVTMTSGSAPTIACNVQGGAFGGAGNIDADPLFVGGPDFHLQAGSPCVDTGAHLTGLPAFDFEGHQRVLGAAPDMGADEVPFSSLRPRFGRR